MKTLNEYIEIIKQCGDKLHTDFGVTSLRIFGSVARNEQHEGSDVDVCVDMRPNMFRRIALKEFLEKQFGCSVDVVRIHRNMNSFLRNQIEKDGILVAF